MIGLVRYVLTYFADHYSKQLIIPPKSQVNCTTFHVVSLVSRPAKRENYTHCATNNYRFQYQESWDHVLFSLLTPPALNTLS